MAKSKKKDDDGLKIVAKNKKAFHEFEIFDRWEAGLVLLGSEVKALREGRCNLGDSYAEIKKGEAWLVKVHIGPYEMANQMNHEPFRRRKLLLNRRELRKIRPRLDEKGLTLVPLKLYFRKGLAKVELGIGRGKKLYDKRHDKAKRDSDMRIRREMGRH